MTKRMCLDEDSLLQVALADACDPELVSHVDGCSHCQDAVARLRELVESLRQTITGVPATTPAVNEPAADARPTALGKYLIVGELGKGGQARVFRGVHVALQRDVAIKWSHRPLAGDSLDRGQLAREGQVLADIDHPGLVRVYDLDVHEGRPYLVMEFVRGANLGEFRPQGRPAPRDAARLVAQVARALAVVHGRGIIHQDIKPENILVDDKGRPRLADFGIARLRNFWSDARAGGPAGTPAYMPVEQLAGSPTPASDIYALGGVLFFLLTGRHPRRLTGDSIEAVEAIRQGKLDLEPLNEPGIPRELARMCRKAMAKEAAQRYQRAEELARELEAFASRPQKLRRSAAVLASCLAAGLAIWGLLTWWPKQREGPPSGAAGQIEAIAVLPFENFSRDPNKEYFSDGMTDALMTDLAGVAALRVISRASVFSYQHANKPLPQIAKELKVDAVVQGSVLLIRDQVRITARLIEAATDRQLWANSYDRHLDDVLALQKEVAREIVGEIKVKLNAQEQARLAEVPRVLRAAYQAYLKGRYFWNKRTEQDLKTAISHFTEATDTDPTYAPAWAGLADCYNFLGYGNYLSPKESFPKGEAAAARARDLDPKLADAYASLGYVRMYYDWNFVEAKKAFRRAIELNPNSATAHHLFSIYLTAMRRDDEARKTIERAQALDPLSVPVTTDMGFELHYMGHDDEAIRQLRTALDMNPKFPLAHFWLGRIYTMQKRYDEALAELEGVDHALRPWQPMMAARGYLYGVWGKRKEAQAVLDDFEALRKSGRFVTSYGVALVHTALGDNEQAFAWLERACDERSHWLVWLALDPRWQRLRSDPRFSKLLHRIGLG